MLAIPELAMPRTRKVTTFCNGRREVWTDYEQAKAYFLEMMMTAEGEERERTECVYIQLIHGLSECSDETNNQKRLCRNAEPFALPSELSVMIMGELYPLKKKDGTEGHYKPSVPS